MSLNVEYIVRLMDALRPYRVKWLEDYLLPEDTDSYIKVRQRLPGVTLAIWRALVHDPPVRAGGQSGPGGHPPAGHLLGRRDDGLGADLSHRRGARPDRHRARRHELPVRPAPGAGDAVDPDGRALRGRGAARACRWRRRSRCRGRSRSRTAASAQPMRPASAWRSTGSGSKRTPSDPDQEPDGRDRAPADRRAAEPQLAVRRLIGRWPHRTRSSTTRRSSG